MVPLHMEFFLSVTFFGKTGVGNFATIRQALGFLLILSSQMTPRVFIGDGSSRTIYGATGYYSDYLSPFGLRSRFQIHCVLNNSTTVEFSGTECQPSVTKRVRPRRGGWPANHTHSHTRPVEYDPAPLSNVSWWSPCHGNAFPRTLGSHLLRKATASLTTKS